MKLFFVAAFLAVAATVPSSYKPEYKAPSYPAQATRHQTMPSLTTQPVKSLWSRRRCKGVTYDSYGKESYGQKFTLTWTADEAGFQPKGDHLPVAPVHEYELPVAPVHEYELPVAPALPYSRTGPGY
ncbi:cuticle protein 3-like [Daphnia magna]|uniref:cuticle protein 3-like n=1 Tax=Daphnia magna TaxID=35525 RepID=UPI001E1BBEA2|nr:cuticle protein 3-like [Daphnia magna]